jgi:hypothetical protein
MRKLALPFILAAVVSAAFFNVGTAFAGPTTVGQAICGASLCGSNTPGGLNYQDWDGTPEACHKNNLANPDFYMYDPDSETNYNIGQELQATGTTWWVYDEGAPPEGNDPYSCNETNNTVLARSMVYVNTSVLAEDWDDQHFPECANNKNPCGSGRTAYYVELTAVPVNGQPVSAGGSMDTHRP